MQNLISNTVSNFEEFLTNNIGATTANVASKGVDFAKIFQNQNETRNMLNQQNEIKKTHTDNSKRNTENKNIHTDSRDEVTKRDFDKQENKTKKVEEKNTVAKEEQNTTTENKVQTTEEKTISKETASETKETTQKIETQETIKEAQKITNSEEKNVDIEATIKNTTENINQLIEQATDGQLEAQDVEALKNALEQLQNKIDNNELVVSEDTQKLIEETLNKLSNQDIKTLEIKVLVEDLKQLQKDIAANAFKLDSQLKTEDENVKNAAITLEVKDDTKNQSKTIQQTSTEQNSTQTKSTQANILVSNEVKDVQNTQKTNTLENIVEQEILDEMQVKVETVSTSTNTNTQGQGYSSNASDEIVKLTIQKNSEAIPNVGVNFDNKNIQLQGANFKNMQIETASKELNTNDILNQIGSKFEQLKDGTQTRITMTLRPHDLGRVTIELTQSANGITTNIIAQNSQIKEMLDKNIDILKQQLAQQGVNVQNVQVKTVEQNAQTSTGNGFLNQENQNHEQDFNQNSNNGQKQRQGQREFAFNQSNIIENIDFEAQNSQTTQINTAGGKISYNL